MFLVLLSNFPNNVFFSLHVLLQMSCPS